MLTTTSLRLDAFSAIIHLPVNFRFFTVFRIETVQLLGNVAVYQTSFALHILFAFAPFRVGVNKSKESGIKQDGIGSYTVKLPALTPTTGLCFFWLSVSRAMPCFSILRPYRALVLTAHLFNASR